MEAYDREVCYVYLKNFRTYECKNANNNNNFLAVNRLKPCVICAVYFGQLLFVMPAFISGTLCQQIRETCEKGWRTKQEGTDLRACMKVGVKRPSGHRLLESTENVTTQSTFCVKRSGRLCCNVNICIYALAKIPTGFLLLLYYLLLEIAQRVFNKSVVLTTLECRLSCRDETPLTPFSICHKEGETLLF